MEIKPILFNTEMVRAILDGRKSCTRRVVKPQPTARYGAQCIKPPYQPGDILYVRETWERFECWNCEGDERGNCPKEPQKSVLDETCGCYMYRATDEISGDARWHLVLCQDLVQVKMRNFSDFNPPEAQPQCVFFHTLVRIHLVTYSYNGYEFVSYCRKLPDIRKSSGMPACNREF